MTPEQQAAYIFTQGVSAMIALQAMLTGNANRARRGEVQAYTESSIRALESEYVISHNAVIGLFHE